VAWSEWSTCIVSLAVDPTLGPAERSQQLARPAKPQPIPVSIPQIGDGALTRSLDIAPQQLLLLLPTTAPHPNVRRKGVPMSTLRRCNNVADSCWREFSEAHFHVRLGDKVFCSETCRDAYIELARTLENAASPFGTRHHTGRARPRET
jgi:hypothetical protein